MEMLPKSIHPEAKDNAREQDTGEAGVCDSGDTTESKKQAAAASRGLYTISGCTKCFKHTECSNNFVDGYGGTPCELLIVLDCADRLSLKHIPALIRTAISHAKIPVANVRFTSAIRCGNKQPLLGLIAKEVHKLDTNYEAARICRDHLLEEIEEVQPKVIITVGELANYALTKKKNKKNYNQINKLETGQYHINILPEFAGLNTKLHAELMSSFKKVNNLILGITYPDDAKYVVVENETQLKAARKILLAAPELVFDFEVDTNLNKVENSFGPEDALLCCGFSYAPGRAITIPLDHVENSTLEFKRQCHQLVKDILRSDIPKIAHNAIYDQFAAWHFYNGLETKNVSFDTMLAHHLLDPTPGTHSLKYLTGLYTPYGGYEDALKPYLQDPVRPTYGDVPLNTLATYCCVDVDMTMRLKVQFNEQIQKDPQLRRLLKRIVIPISDVFYGIRKTGMKINKRKLLNTRQYYEKLKNQAEQVLYSNPIVQKHCPTLNLASPKQIQNLLYTVLKLKVPKQTKTLKPSTDEEALRRLHARYKDTPGISEILDSITTIRKANKFIGTYIDGLIPHINNNTLYTTYLLHGTVSGRPSSIAPNLLNIPSESAKDTPIQFHIKSAFEAPLDYFFVSADYSQIELRNIGNETKEPNLVDAYLAGDDMHRKTASLIFGKPSDDIPEYMRKIGKTTNFGGAYGAGPATLAAQIEKSGELSDDDLKAAVDFVHIPRPSKAELTATDRDALLYKLSKYIQNTLFQKWATFGAWQRAQRTAAKISHSTISRFGRTRLLHFPPKCTNSEEWRLVNIAVNHPIQSVSSDCLLLAMVRLEHEIKTRKLKSRICGQVYDSINFYIHKDEKDLMLRLIRTVMECEPLLFDPEYFTIPLEVDIEIGSNWGQLEKLDMETITYLEGVYNDN